MSEIKTPAQNKRETFEQLMQDEFVLVHIDARKDGVAVPTHLGGDPSLTLKMSYLFQGEVTHDMQTITAYLKFDGEYHCCIVPWEAVWGMTAANNENAVWPESIPKEVLLKITGAKVRELGQRIFGFSKKDKVDLEPTPQGLKLVAKDEAEAEAEEDLDSEEQPETLNEPTSESPKEKSESPKEKSDRPRPQLKRIK